jgi:hypothetical protein
MTEELNINQLIEKRAENKYAMDELNAQLKELRETQNHLDVLLLKKMDAEGLSRTANTQASVSINEDTVPDVIDWEQLYQYVYYTQDFSLIQRRVSSTAYKELLKLGESVPGLQPRVVRRINFKSL